MRNNPRTKSCRRVVRRSNIICGKRQQPRASESSRRFHRKRSSTPISNGSKRNTIHPTQKPVDLLRYLVLTYTNEGDTVLDNCMGSGTTAIACIKERRHFIGFELSKEYFDKAVRRIKAEQAQLTLF